MVRGAVRQKIEMEWGWAEATVGEEERIGDRLVPPAIEVHFPGADGQPSLHLDLAVVDGVPQCRGLRLDAVEGGREIRGLDLRAIRLSEWVDDIFEWFAMRVIEEKAGTVTAVRHVDADVGAVADFRQARKGKAARKITPELLRGVADVYRAHLNDRPTRAVRDTFGVGERAAAGYVQKARDPEACGHQGPHGGAWLAPTTRGKKGG